MAKLIKDDLSIKNKIVSFDVKVRDGITIIGGDSATGKSLYFKEMQLHSQRYKDDSYVYINYTNGKEFYRLLDDNVNDKIVFVDNADIVVSEDIDTYRKIRNIQDQFVFFGRDITRYDKNYDNWAEFVERKSGVFKLSYVFRKAGQVWQ